MVIARDPDFSYLALQMMNAHNSQCSPGLTFQEYSFISEVSR